MLLPFLYIALGLLLGVLIKKESFYRISEKILGFALYLLLFCIGLGIGSDKDLLFNLPSLGLSSLLISGMAILCSVGLSLILEGILKKEKRLLLESNASSLKELGGILLLPFILFLGVLVGSRSILFKNLGFLFDVSLFLLYVSLGMSQRNILTLIKNMKNLGLEVILLPLVITLGSILGGFLGSLITGVDLKVSILSSAGLGYYSLTGAYLSSSIGVEAGSFGFMVNVFRDVLTILLIPLFKRLGLFSAIASGAGGSMDTMLGPITKTFGNEHLFFILSVGTLLTILVPFLLLIINKLL